MTSVESTAQCTTSNFFSYFLSPSFKATLSPKAPGDHKKEDERPPPSHPSQFAHINQLHTRSTYQYSECGLRDAVRGGLRWAWGFSIQPHSQEPLKCSASIMESLIGAHSARKVFSEKKRKKKKGSEWAKERKESFRGSGNHYVRCLEYVKFIQASSHKSPIPHFFLLLLTV